MSYGICVLDTHFGTLFTWFPMEFGCFRQGGCRERSWPYETPSLPLDLTRPYRTISAPLDLTDPGLYKIIIDFVGLSENLTRLDLLVYA